MTTTTQNPLQTMTYEEDKKALTQVIDEIKKETRGRKKQIPEEVRERKQAYDRRIYHLNPERKKEYVKQWRALRKALLELNIQNKITAINQIYFLSYRS